MLADLETEVAVLCDLLVRPERLREVQDLEPKHFFADVNRWVFEELVALVRGGERPDTVRLSLRLRQRGLSNAANILGEILCAPVVIDLRPHVETLIEFYRRRQLHELIDEVQLGITSRQLSADEAIEKLAGFAP